MKTLQVRKLGPVRMTSVVVACYVIGAGCTHNCPVSI
jgi:hypothetical protein